MNLDSKGNYVSIKIRGFPENPEYTPFDIDASSVQVQGISIEPKFKKFVDKRFSGKVDRLSLEDAIGAPGKEVEIIVDGELYDGTTFIGIGSIKAIRHNK